MTVAEVLSCPNADQFLSLEPRELETRIDHRRSSSDLPTAEILKGKAGSLLKKPSEIEKGLDKKQKIKKFRDKKSALTKSVATAFKRSNINGKFKIKPVLNSDGNEVAVTITAPEEQIWDAVKIISEIKAGSALDESAN